MNECEDCGQPDLLLSINERGERLCPGCMARAEQPARCERCGQPCHPAEAEGCDACLEAQVEAQAEAACQGDF